MATFNATYLKKKIRKVPKFEGIFEYMMQTKTTHTKQQKTNKQKTKTSPPLRAQ